MSIKYYHLAKDEELPEEFCAIRDEGGEPNGYVFYMPESEVAKLRELARKMWKPFCWAQSGYDVCLSDEEDRAIRDMVRELGVEVE